MTITLRAYQTQGIDDIAKKYASGIRRQIFQLPTGSGKTITFGGLCHRYLNRFNKRIVIAVHRDELLTQSVNVIRNTFGIPCDTIQAGKTHINPKAKVLVAMVETITRRLDKDHRILRDVGMLIVDECHIGNFKKLYKFFPESLIVGFSATPISSSKKDPLINYFDDITCGPDILELIHDGNLCENETYSMKGVKRSELKTKNGEFDMSDMALEYSKHKHVKNVVEAYERLCIGEKTLIFNCNVEHSKLVCKAFNDAGYEARHLDGSETKSQRAETLHWYKHNPRAILCNIGVLTTGFDEPSIINIIVNRSTLSLPLWLQMTGRGSRPTPTKSIFKIIDMGGNVDYHGDWRDDRDWNDLFFNPEKPRNGKGEAPVKDCKQCSESIPAQSFVCKHCGFVDKRKITYDAIAPIFEKVVDAINVNHILYATQGQHEFAPFMRIMAMSVKSLKDATEGAEIDHLTKEKSYQRFFAKVVEWRRLCNKPVTKHIEEYSYKKFGEEVRKINAKRMGL